MVSARHIIQAAFGCVLRSVIMTWCLQKKGPIFVVLFKPLSIAIGILIGVTFMDRFIPNRSAIDFDYAHYMVTDGRKVKENPTVSSPSREAYRKRLAVTFNMNRTRILAFRNKPPTPTESMLHDSSAV